MNSCLFCLKPSVKDIKHTNTSRLLQPRKIYQYLDDSSVILNTAEKHSLKWIKLTSTLRKIKILF